MTYFICRLPNLKYALIVANIQNKQIKTFCPKSKFQQIYDVKSAICHYLDKDESEFTLEEGVCPEVAENVDTAVIVAELVNILVNKGDLEQFQDEISVEKIAQIKKQLYFSLLAQKVV